MSNDIPITEPVTIMFTDHVRTDKVAEYETWSAGIHGDAQRFPGHISVDVIRPDSTGIPEFTTLVKFDNQANLKRWRDSTGLAEWLEQLPELLVGSTHAQKSVGPQLWFDRPRAAPQTEEPPFWKRTLIGIGCVYPLILLLDWALRPITSSMNFRVGLFVNVVVLSSLLTYPVMPWVTRLLHHWLYPTSKRADR